MDECMEQLVKRKKTTKKKLLWKQMKEMKNVEEEEG